MGFIYKITSPTGRLYVGKTKHLGRRINTYKYKIIKNTGWVNSMIMNSLQKHGWDSHKFEIIEEIPNDLLNEREVFWIKELKTYCFENPRNMNMSRGGEEGGRTWMYDVERRKRQGERFSGEGNPFYGKTHSAEFKAKKSKEVSQYNKKIGWKVPEWGAEKGRNVVRKPIVCYDRKGVFVKEFNCAATAEKELKLDHASISEVCSKKRTHTGGFVFRYKTDNYPLKIDVGILKEQAVRKPVILIRRHKKNKTFKSPQAAAKETGVPLTTIRRAAAYNKMKPIRNGMVFVYKEDYIQQPEYFGGDKP